MSGLCFQRTLLTPVEWIAKLMRKIIRYKIPVEVIQTEISFFHSFILSFSLSWSAFIIIHI